MARKVLGFERVLGTRELFAIAYGEIGSSLYFALGIVVAAALGLTPLVLLGTGAVFLVVALSYAELSTAIPETGGAETFTRRAFNDLVGFVTGWALFLDYVIVIALSALFIPHYLGVAIQSDSLRESPWDIVAAAFVIAGIAIARLIRHSRIHSGLVMIAALDLVVQGADRPPRRRVAARPGEAQRRLRARYRAGVGRRAVCDPARVPRLHRARDGRELRPGGRGARA